MTHFYMVKLEKEVNAFEQEYECYAILKKEDNQIKKELSALGTPYVLCGAYIINILHHLKGNSNPKLHSISYNAPCSLINGGDDTFMVRGLVLEEQIDFEEGMLEMLNEQGVF